MRENRVAIFGLIAGLAFVSFSFMLVIIEITDSIGLVLGGLLCVHGAVVLGAVGFLVYALCQVDVEESDSMMGSQ